MKVSSTIVLAIVAVQSVGSGTRCTRTRLREHVGSIVRRQERLPSKRRLTVCAAGVATAVVLAGCGSSSSGGTPSAGGSTPSRSESTSPGPAGGKPSTSPLSASPFPAEGEDTATLKAGRYVTTDPFPVPVSVTVPAGWISEEPGPYAVFLSTADGEGNDGPAVLTLLLSPIEF